MTNDGKKDGTMNQGKKRALACILIAAAVVCAVAVWGLCSGNAPKRETNAVIRYFDGVCEMVIVNRWKVSGGSVILRTAEGRTLVAGANNVLIIEEDAEE